MKYIIISLLVVLCGFTVLYLYGRGNTSGPFIGMKIDKNKDLYGLMKSLGYVEMGEFRPKWPAHIVDIIEANGGITFPVPGNSPHIYDDPAYVGYKFTAITLATLDDKYKFVMLYKTKDKVYDVE